MKTDAKHWKQYNKIAVITDKKSVQKAEYLGYYLPGFETKHFDKDE
ncbi:STAS/SEC14 domain-containing protein [Thalassobacillus devorans]|nr:STAS/SEC14 domain-containing protein [Thalassobacillus devorans]